MKQRLLLKLKAYTPFFIGSGTKYAACQIVKIGEKYYKARDMCFFRFLHRYPKLKDGDNFKKIVNSTVPYIEREIDAERDLHYQLKNFAGVIEGEIIQMLKHPSGAAYIPGSSIKGAIRTAIEYHLMKKNPDYFNSIVLDALKKSRRRQDLQVVTREVHNRLRLYKDDLRSDFSRFLIVRDTNLVNVPFSLFKVGVFKILSNKLDSNSARRTFLIEAIAPSVEFEVEILFDLDGLESIQRELSKNFVDVPGSIDQILDCVREMYSDVVMDELKDLKNDNTKYRQILQTLKDRADKIHIGYGGGLKACSLFILLNDELRKEVRNLIKPHGKDLAPLSRRVIMNGLQAISPIGWFTFQVV